MTIDIKKLRKIMRTDDGINGDAQRLEQLVWMLFMKLFDTKEDEWQLKAQINKKEYEFAVDLGRELQVTKRTVLNYLQKKSKGFLNKGIKEI